PPGPQLVAPLLPRAFGWQATSRKASDNVIRMRMGSSSIKRDETDDCGFGSPHGGVGDPLSIRGREQERDIVAWAARRNGDDAVELRIALRAERHGQRCDRDADAAYHRARDGSN